MSSWILVRFVSAAPQWTPKLYFKKILEPICSLQHYSQFPRHGSSLNDHWQRNGLRRCGTYIYKMEYYSAIKNEIMPLVATWMQLEIIMLSGISPKEKDIHTMWYHLDVESKIWHKWTYLQNRSRLTDMENRPAVAKGEGEGREMDWEFAESRCKLLHFKWISNEVLYHRELHPVSWDIIRHTHTHTHTQTHIYD